MLSAVVVLALGGSATASLEEGLGTGDIPMTDVSGSDSADQGLADLTLTVEPDAAVTAEPEGISPDDLVDPLDPTGTTTEPPSVPLVCNIPGTQAFDRSGHQAKIRRGTTAPVNAWP